MTWASIRLSTGSSVAQLDPTASDMVDRLIAVRGDEIVELARTILGR